jgi:DNA-directed RNA polymerase
MSDLTATQVALEEEATALGQQRYASQQARLQESGRDADQGVVAAAVRRATETLSAAIQIKLDEYRAKPGRLALAISCIDRLQLEPDALAVITLRAVMTGAGSDRAWAGAAQHLAEDCINEWNFRRLQVENSKAYEIMQKHLPKKQHGTRHARRVTQHETGMWDTLSQDERMHLGSWLLDALVSSTGLFETELSSSQGRKTTRVLVPTPVHL